MAMSKRIIAATELVEVEHGSFIPGWGKGN